MSPRPYRLIQISDLHLPAPPGGRYRTIDPQAQLEVVLSHIEQHHPGIDRLLLTGDLVHGGDSLAYAGLYSLLSSQAFPWSWIPGNHDCAEAMAELRQPGQNMFPVPGWQLALLDSTAQPDGCGAGSLNVGSWQCLEQSVGASEPVLIVVHHNPMPVGSQWQDAIGLQEAARFWQCAEQLPRGSLILCGHLHQVWDVCRSGVRILSCPSTAVQFKPGCEVMTLETDADRGLPGYRWLDLHQDGQLETGIERVCLA